ncbi:MAG TPA: alpha/beta hydrolase [Rhizomicrobium sp.]|jgi:acetyl esterase|nr:alpha/beta hydrolase [Rhizomicrobium sp.]
MSLDPVLKNFLAQLYAQPGPKMWEFTPAEARQAFVLMMQFVAPKNVIVDKVENLRVPGPQGEISLRSYTPAGAGAGTLPALLFFHGGGFVIGNLDTHDGLCRVLANESAARVVAVDYRLAPEYKFPAAVDDAWAALSWLAANAERLGVDQKRIAIGGDSAGAALATVSAHRAKEEGGPNLALQLLMFPPTDLAAETPSRRKWTEGYFLDKLTIEWFFDNYLPRNADRRDPRLSPLRAGLRGIAPAYILTAQYDPLRDEALEYAAKLRDSGVPVTVVDYPDLVHDFIYLDAVLPQAREALSAAARAVRDALHSR